MFHVINHTADDIVIFEGEFTNFKSCLEEAVKLEVPLDFADLSGKCLINANLDGGSFKHASFAGANLMGANISDANLDHADFKNCSLQNCCFCYSLLTNCNFEGALFGGADIAGSDISYSKFSTLSALLLNFIDTQNMRDCRFIDGENVYPFSQPVIAINGLAYPVAFFDRHIKIGSCSYELLNLPVSTHAPGNNIYQMLLSINEMLRGTSAPSFLKPV